MLDEREKAQIAHIVATVVEAKMQKMYDQLLESTEALLIDLAAILNERGERAARAYFQEQLKHRIKSRPAPRRSVEGFGQR